MIINKNDVLNSARKIEQKSHRKQASVAENSGSASKSENAKTLSFDGLRGKILGIQESVKHIQTQITQNQIQSEFISDLKETKDWKKSLQKFATNKFSIEKKSLEGTENSKQYADNLNSKIEELTVSLKQEEVKMENLISSGLIDDVDLEAIEEIVEENAQKQSFTGMSSDTVRNLLKG